MDDHFEQMLAPSTAAALNRSKYIPVNAFEGRKLGFVFKKGAKGLGYYSDHTQKLPVKADGYDYQAEDAAGKKRKHEEDEDESEGIEEEAVTVEGGRQLDIDRMLTEAEAVVEQLDANSLKQLLLSFEKKITRNLKMRMKNSEEPEKFMESELELHADINELYAIAASPELYSTFVEAGSVNSVLGMITHENTDISIAAVGLLHEMTDVDTILEEESAMVFIDALINSQGLELLVQNLSRLDESSDEDAQGVNYTMGCIENLVEIRPSIAVSLCERTHVLKFLLLRLKVKKFDSNKLYCSEILSVLLQADVSNQIRVCNIQGLDGMEVLLQAVSLYRKKDPGSPDEEECVENLFSCLCTVLLQIENQKRFAACEGLELMTRCFNEQKYSSVCALRVVKFAISGNKANCKRFISSGGLKHVFPMLMGRGLPKLKKKSSKSGSNREVEETVIAIISQLIIQLHDCNEEDISQRLLKKMTDNNGEKLDRCAELCVKYAKILLSSEKQIESTAEALKEGEDEEELEEFLQSDNVYNMRLDGGLFTLQQLSSIIIFTCLKDNDKGKNKSAEKAQIKLEGEDLFLEDLVNVLREAAVHMYDKKNKKDSDNDQVGSQEDPVVSDTAGEDKERDEDREKQRQLLVDWSIAAEAFTVSHEREDDDKEDVEGGGE